MYQIKLNLFLFLSFNIFHLSAMEINLSDSESSQSNSESAAIVVQIVDLEQLYDKLVIFDRNQKAIEAAENCDLDALQQYVDETNVNNVNSDGLSLLSLVVKSSKNNQAAIDYLYSQGAKADERINKEQRHSALITAITIAIFFDQFRSLKYLLKKKNANPFLRNQSIEGTSAAHLVVENLAGTLSEKERSNMTKIVKQFTALANNLPDAIETFNVRKIKQFANPKNINIISADGFTPLLQVATICTDKLRENQNQIFEILFSHGALPNQNGIINNLKRVPLQYITFNSLRTCNTESIQIFLKHGADPLLNLEENENKNNSSYGIANKLLQAIKNHGDKCHKCQEDDCTQSIKLKKQKATATEILDLFDAHLSK
jgi:hypothetical protein